MRYGILVILNLPVILLALLNMLTQYKMQKITKHRFRQHFIVWSAILIVLIGSFPLYNLLNDKPMADSSELSLFDIVQSTALVFLFYVINYQRQHIERTEKTVRELHQELSIILSKEKQ